jgi:hypothetical protein
LTSRMLVSSEMLVPIVGLEDCNDLFGVNRDVSCANPILRSHDHVRFSVRGKLAHCDIVETFE